jgi:ectoine hydroxylase-related dioxygenase (phytanoyl-CoA dioxygenase family)
MRAHTDFGCTRTCPGRPLSLSILLEDTPQPNGTTVLVPGSFRWAPVINSFPVVHPKHFGNRGQGLTGEAGSVYLFSPTTWHGRAGQPKRDQTVLMMSFLPAGSDAPLRTPGPEIFDGLPEPLQQLFSPAQTPKIQPMNSELNQLLSADYPVSLGSPWRLMM